MKDYYPNVTFEDGVFRFDLPNGDEFVIVPPKPRKLSDGCGNCHACLVGVMENNMPVTSQRMIVCSDCGNKRCPKASNHRHKCTGSNEVGQHGSIYTAPRELSDEEIKAIANNLTCTPDKNWNVLFAKAILKKASEK